MSLTTIRYTTSSGDFQFRMGFERMPDGSCDIFFHDKKKKEFYYGFTLLHCEHMDAKGICHKSLDMLEAMVTAHKLMHS